MGKLISSFKHLSAEISSDDLLLPVSLYCAVVESTCAQHS